MRDKLYNLMNWRDIEGVLYADLDRPGVVLGSVVSRGNKLIQVFVPDAVKVEIVFDDSGKVYQTEEVDDYFFVTQILKKESGLYKVKAYYCDGVENIYYDPYQFEDLISKTELKKFNCGNNYRAYEILGAHIMEYKGVKGVRFAVWAPFAKRVSVVGDFNFWDGRRHIMSRIGDSGVFEIFVPELRENELYKFEIKKIDGNNVLKSDPYGFYSQIRPDNASIVNGLNKFEWSDEKWIETRKKQIIQKDQYQYMKFILVHGKSQNKKE